MKKLFAISFTSIFLATGLLVAQDAPAPTTPPLKQCRMDCKVAEKAKLDTCLATAKAIPKGKGSGRRAAVKKCMTDFKQALRACRVDCKKPCDPAPCQATCASGQADAVASCNSTFDPAGCGGDAACEAEIIGQREKCVTDANGVFANCASLCTCN